MWSLSEGPIFQSLSIFLMWQVDIKIAPRDVLRKTHHQQGVTFYTETLIELIIALNFKNVVEQLSSGHQST